MNDGEFKLKRRGRPRKFNSHEELVKNNLIKSFKLFKMCVLDNNNTNIKPWWIAEFDEPINSKTLFYSIVRWKMLNIDNYSQVSDPYVIARNRRRTRGPYKRRNSDNNDVEDSNDMDGNDVDSIDEDECNIMFSPSISEEGDVGESGGNGKDCVFRGVTN